MPKQARGRKFGSKTSVYLDEGARRLLGELADRWGDSSSEVLKRAILQAWAIPELADKYGFPVPKKRGRQAGDT